MTEHDTATLQQLRAKVRGDIVVDGDDGYDQARRVWNADIDRRPAVIVRCADTEDVRAAVAYAVEHRLEVAVRGGAHSMAGASVVDDGLMIDLSAMNAVTVDPQERRARVAGGALLADLDAATQAHALAVPAGMISHTGVGGLTLGGGMGWLTRKHGLTIDNLVSAEVVTADGRVLRASQDEHAELFWALRGGGGNFGVVTEFELALHPVDPMVHFAMLFFPLEQARDALRSCRSVLTSLPESVNVVVGGMNAPPEPFVPQEHQLALGVNLLVVGFGSEAEHAEVLSRMRAEVPPAWEFVTPMPYVALQQMLDEPNAWGQYDYEKSLYLQDLSDDAIDVLVEHLPGKTSPGSVVLLYRLDGAYSAVDDDATAFSGGRSARFSVFVIGVCADGASLAVERGWVRGLYDALSPLAGTTGTYVNTLSEVSGEDRVRAAYGARTYERLARVKAEYDPHNVFRRNANIRPSAAPPEQRASSSLESRSATVEPA